MAEEDLETGEEKKSSKLLIIIIVVLLLIIVGGGVAFFLMGTDDAASTDTEEMVEKVKEEPAEEISKEIYYYEMEQPLRVNFPKGESASLIEVRIAFLVKDESTQDGLKKHQPMLVNNLLMAISAAGANGLQSKQGKDELRKKMLEETGKVMEKMTGRDRVREIFFTAFVMQ
jgi:flagellar protein FliL